MYRPGQLRNQHIGFASYLAAVQFPTFCLRERHLESRAFQSALALCRFKHVFQVLEVSQKDQELFSTIEIKVNPDFNVFENCNQLRAAHKQPVTSQKGFRHGIAP